MKRLLLLGGACCCLTLCASASSSSAEDSFRGKNGRIAYLTGNHISFVTPDGQVRGTYAPTIDASRVAWSPDGRRLLVSSSDGVYLADATVERLRQLPLKHSWQSAPADATWSPDGKEIVFGADSGRRCRSLFRHRLSDDRDLRLTRGCDDLRPAWSPDSRSIAYVSGLSVCIWQLQEHRRRCVGHGSDPTWSPDGKQLAYTTGRTLRLVNSTTQQTEELDLTTGDPRESVSSPTWSPDGSEIAFIREELAAKFERHLYATPRNGTSFRRLGNSVYDDRPDWQAVRPRR